MSAVTNNKSPLIFAQQRVPAMAALCKQSMWRHLPLLSSVCRDATEYSNIHMLYNVNNLFPCFTILFVLLSTRSPSLNHTCKRSGSVAFYIIQSPPGHMGETTSSKQIILSYVTIRFAIVEIISLVAVVQWYSMGFLPRNTKFNPQSVFGREPKSSVLE